MNFKCGIVGLPNVGKSTLFNALTKLNIEVANFPFCTILPNKGVVAVPDWRIDKLVEIVKPQRIISSTIEFVDIAGLVKGASKGRGLGNQFLTNISNTDAIIHVVRCFCNDDIIHVTGKVNPTEDINVINTELMFYDLNICDKAISHISKKYKNGDKHARERLTVLEKCILQLENSNMLYCLNLDKKEKELINYLNLLTIKPTVYIANINEDGIKNSFYLDQIHNIVAKYNSTIIPICANIEAQIAYLEERKRDSFMQKLGFEKSNLNYILKAGYNLLNLQTYFTVDTKEVRSWTIPIGTTALQAAKKIHTDFEKGFICAQIISYEDFILYKSRQKVKEAGKMRSEGKNYIVKDGDIVNFLFNI